MNFPKPTSAKFYAAPLRSRTGAGKPAGIPSINGRSSHWPLEVAWLPQNQALRGGMSECLKGQSGGRFWGVHWYLFRASFGRRRRRRSTRTSFTAKLTSSPPNQPMQDLRPSWATTRISRRWGSIVVIRGSGGSAVRSGVSILDLKMRKASSIAPRRSSARASF